MEGYQSKVFPDEFKREYKFLFINKKGEYKKDNFGKGKILNSEYFSKAEITENKFKKIKQLNRNMEYEILKNGIKYFEEAQRKTIATNILKINILLQMLEYKFLEDKIYTEKSEKFVIKSSNKNQYVNELKSIQKALRITLMKVKTAEKEQVNKENPHILKYENIIKEIQKSSNISALAMKKIEEDKKK
ncbi:hypothetical protein EII29_08555 [Leptotrichia sp. OH3620_COT-345]|uniref:hypothetical protein n=1 Tax=Leptotrichia sp. OH3620_COT-345 TaxID=2491048 RepID=UPI000F653436|nr:hypothetical protein [Leptotrichia sp. OH3620_COT-345]RRD39154.1 hypothetical protein EII29_08555 [Leptotrichia sp. OH3620_COT-345]